MAFNIVTIVTNASFLSLRASNGPVLRSNVPRSAAGRAGLAAGVQSGPGLGLVGWVARDVVVLGWVEGAAAEA